MLIMKILSIETSCDDTGISILEAKGGIKNPRPNASGGQASFNVLADSLASQVKIHAQYGGVFPMMAKREHIKNLPILFEKTLKKAGFKSPQGKTFLNSQGLAFSRFEKNPGIDLIAVTSGPGLEPALWTGIVFAQELAKKWKVPVVPVNHMEGHILSVFAKQKGKFTVPKIKFPMLSLLVSGGHTELVLSKSWLKYEVIGETLDDAAGEAFDKVARMLGLPYPGGPEISKLAQEARKQKLEVNFKLPRPMMYSKNFDFSFSGLKTAVLYLIRDFKKENPNILQDNKIKQEIALEFENAVVETLIYKTKKAIGKYNIKTLIVAGGVSANKYLRSEVKKEFKKHKILFPGKGLSMDNSIMIGMAGYFRFLEKKGKIGKALNIKASGNLHL